MFVHPGLGSKHYQHMTKGGNSSGLIPDGKEIWFRIIIIIIIIIIFLKIKIKLFPLL